MILVMISVMILKYDTIMDHSTRDQKIILDSVIGTRFLLREA